jgi:predicted RecA/RadA family phage recombinase
MARNYVQPGKVLTLTAPYQRDSGKGALVGSLFAVALQTVANAVAGEFAVSGVWTLDKTSAQAWTVGQKIYWDNGNKRCDSDSTVGQLIGVATAVADNPSSTGEVRLNGAAPATAEGPQGAIVALTDNTGDSGTHDDTLADGLTATAPAAITDYTAVVNMTDPVTKAEGEAVSAALATLENEVTALRATVAAVVTDVTVQNQNDSDLAQKILEIRTALIAAGILAA